MIFLMKIKTSFRVLLVIAIWICTFAGCKKVQTENEFVRETENEFLNSLLGGAPVQLIDLDKSNADSIHIEDQNIMGMDSIEDFPFPLDLYGVNGMIAIGDSVYVAAQRHNNIWVMNRSGIWIRKVGREGRGPGEFRNLRSLNKNNHSIYSMDVGNQRVFVYDYDLNFKNSLDAQFTWPENNMAVDDVNLYLPTDLSSENLIEIRDANAPFNQKGTFVPRLIPNGMQPFAYNLYKITANHNELIAFGYTGLPYVFIFDKTLKHILTLVLKSETFNEFENPPVRPVRGSENDIYRVNLFFEGLFLMENGSLYIAQQPFLHRLNWNGEQFDVMQSWRYTYSEPDENEDSVRTIYVHDVIAETNVMYLSSRLSPYVFRIYLN